MISLCLPSPNRIHMFTYFMRLIAGLGHRFRSENPFASIKEWNFINQSNNEIVWGSFVIILIKKWDTIEIIAKSSLKRWENNYSCIVFEKNRRRNRTIPELFKSFFQTWAFWIRMLNEGKQEQENIESCVCVCVYWNFIISTWSFDDVELPFIRKTACISVPKRWILSIFLLLFIHSNKSHLHYLQMESDANAIECMDGKTVHVAEHKR